MRLVLSVGRGDEEVILHQVLEIWLHKWKVIESLAWCLDLCSETCPPPNCCQVIRSYWCTLRRRMGFPGGSGGKESTCNSGDLGLIPDSEGSPGEGNGNPLQYARHSSMLAWRIPWTEEPGRLQSMGSQGVRHNWATNTFTSLFTSSRALILVSLQRGPWGCGCMLWMDWILADKSGSQETE